MRKLIFLVLICAATNAWAVEEIMHSYKSVRQQGMGGVVTTMGLYDEALFANPATQLEDPNWKLQILSATLEANTHFLSDLHKVSDIKSASGAGVIQTIGNDNLAGNNEHYRVGVIVPGFYSPKFFGDDTSFAFALLIDNQTNIMLRSNSDIDMQAMLNIGPSFGFGHRFLDGKLDVGVNVHVQYRISGDPSFNAANFLAGQTLSFSKITGQGIGLDGDLGAYYKIPYDFPFFKGISVGGSLNSVMQSTYRMAGTTLVKTINGSGFGNDRTAALGVRADLPDAFVLTKSAFAFEWQDIGTTRRLASFWKKFHMGGETHLIGLLAVRGGFNEGYLSGGVGLDLPLLKIDVSTYGEELGANTGRLEDRRVAVRVALEI